MKTKQIRVSSFVDRHSSMTVADFEAFIGDNTVAIIEKKGHLLLLDIEIFSSILNGYIPESILPKLMSRGFIRDVKGSHDVNQKEKKLTKPYFFMIDLTNQCNMRCKYCFRKIESTAKDIRSDILQDICEYIKNYCDENHIRNATIQPWGGEPLLALDSILYMRKSLISDKTKYHFSLETNAISLKKNVIEALYNHRIGLGISIDGYKEIHDTQRILINGNGTHDIVEKNLLLAKKYYKNKLGIITTITKKNAPFIEKILEYYATGLELNNVKFNFVHHAEFSEGYDLCLSEEEIQKAEIALLHKLIDLNNRGYQITENNIKVKLKNLLLGLCTDICHSCGCLGGRRMVVFDREGGIYPCELTDFPKEKIGSIYNAKSLLATLKEVKTHRDFFLPKYNEKCKTCLWYVFCRGGCTVRTISNHQRPPKIDNIECAVNSTLYPALMDLIVEKPSIVNRLMGYSIL